MKKSDLDTDSNLPTELRVNPLKDTSNPRSVINITPSSISSAIRLIPDQVFAMSEDDLKKQAKNTVIEERLRIAFWREYDIAQVTGKKMNLSNIYGGICTQAHFLRNIVSNSFRLAYILTPPTDYEVQMREMLNLGLEQLRDILVQPHVYDDGTPNPKMADVKQKIVESLHLRVKGAVPYRMETKNLNVNVDQSISGHGKSDLTQLKDMREIDAKLRELEREVEGVIDVQAEERVVSESPEES